MMNAMQACAVVAQQRPIDSLLVATMSAMNILDRLDTELAPTIHAPRATRISSVPLMGGAAGLGLGLALAQRQRQVIVMDGDASLLLELSGLVSVVTAGPRKLLHIVVRNGTQFNGLANLRAPAPDYDFAAGARSAGYAHVETIEDAAQWAQRFPQLLALPGPVFVELRVEPLPQRSSDGFVQTEMPDIQFERMGLETSALQRWLQTQGA